MRREEEGEEKKIKCKKNATIRVKEDERLV